MKKDSYTELTTRNRPWGVTTNDEIDLPETCDEVGENKIELDLQEPSVVRIIKDNSEGLDWDTVMHKAEDVDGYTSSDRRGKNF
ncbi:11421_t:CDS:2 [Entrophospora sp. SA101]|nr:11421_t:CDS:2 [Entrophospora sp. SA101]CAJ0824753.1 9560_t:CDS:2 [Entrophospora sp. SA101]CAJ0831546.1 12918_t:CDS:2 [Entrophospora sp. SA101]